MRKILLPMLLLVLIIMVPCAMAQDTDRTITGHLEFRPLPSCDIDAYMKICKTIDCSQGVHARVDIDSEPPYKFFFALNDYQECSGYFVKIDINVPEGYIVIDDNITVKDIITLRRVLIESRELRCGNLMLKAKGLFDSNAEELSFQYYRKAISICPDSELKIIAACEYCDRLVKYAKYRKEAVDVLKSVENIALDAPPLLLRRYAILRKDAVIRYYGYNDTSLLPVNNFANNVVDSCTGSCEGPFKDLMTWYDRMADKRDRIAIFERDNAILRAIEYSTAAESDITS